ncbi:MAG: response regulator [Anaerolineales bacterium]|jgi:CheY-like chemotaxis protein
MATILIVDDQVSTLDLMAATIRMLGHEPIIANNAPQALELIASDPPDLVLLDLMMPGMNGLEMLSRLRANTGNDQPPVVVITAGGEYDIEDRVLEAGGTACLQKPIKIEQLKETINSFLNHD